jgi:predicted transcriptional regulator
VTRTPDDQAVRQLARRLVELRLAHFGEHGGPLLAMLVGVPHREWYGYEAGKSVPLSVLRKLAEITDTDLEWLRTGHGPRGEKPERLDLGLGDRW